MNLRLSWTPFLKEEVSPSCRRLEGLRRPPGFHISVFLQRRRELKQQDRDPRTKRSRNLKPSSLQGYDRTKQPSPHFAWTSENLRWTSRRLKSSLKSVSLMKDEWGETLGHTHCLTSNLPSDDDHVVPDGEMLDCELQAGHGSQTFLKRED